MVSLPTILLLFYYSCSGEVEPTMRTALTCWFRICKVTSEIFIMGVCGSRKVHFPGTDRPNQTKIVAGKRKIMAGNSKKIWREIIFLVVVCKNIFFIFVKFDLLPNGFVPSSTRAID